MGRPSDVNRKSREEEYMLASMAERAPKETAVTVEEHNNTHQVLYLRRPVLELILDLILALLPLLFLALAIAAQIINGQPRSNDGQRIINALILGPTVFPIIFAALCGHFMKSLALYKSQTGLRMRVSHLLCQ